MNNSLPPLGERLRPTSLDQVVGQDELLGEGSPLRRAITTGHIPSIIFWGPPGVGKTTISRIIAESSGRDIHILSAVHAGVKDVRQILDQAKKQDLYTGKSPILFIDEIHRFNKSQQDSLLAAVEAGHVILIGATTENPSFEVNAALLSRCQVHVLNALGKEDLQSLMERALEQDQLLKDSGVQVVEANALMRYSGGDGRKLLNALEAVTLALPEDEKVITDEWVQKVLSSGALKYDKSGEQHYDVISAFIKSIRGSDPNAAVYWLARMVEGGEDAKFIARRLIILASEDIGLANPTALIMANNCAQAVERIGWPESRIILSQCSIYLALSPKSNSAYMAIGKAQQEVRRSGALDVPLHLRNAPTKLMKELGYGQEYNYSHDNPGHFAPQEYLPQELEGTGFFQPSGLGKEASYVELIGKLWGDKY